MKESVNKKYKYRKWPLFVICYFLFAIFYFFFVYSLKEFSYQAFAETLIMDIFVVSSPLLVYFYFKIVKIKEYKILGLQLFYSWLTSTLSIFVLLLTYMKGWDWFGAIALLFFLFCYHFFWFIFSFLLFRVKKRKINNKN